MAVFAVRNRVTRAGGALLMLSCFRRVPRAARRSAAGNPAGSDRYDHEVLDLLTFLPQQGVRLSHAQVPAPYSVINPDRADTPVAFERDR